MAYQKKQNINVLIVEDNETDRKVFKLFLAKNPAYKYSIKECADLKTALEIIPRENIGLILLDLNISDSRGLKTLEAIHEKEQDAAIIVITGIDDEETAYQSISLGAQEYLVKGDFDISVFNRVVRYAVERKKTELALREEDRMLYTLMSNLPGVVYRALYDEAHTLEFVSEGIRDITGYSPYEMLNNGINYFSLINKDDREALNAKIKIALKSRKLFQVVYRIKTRNGEEKWVWEQGQGVYSSRGALLFIEGFITDITKAKDAEEELERSYKKLARTLDETVNVLAATIETRDQYTAGHQKRVAELSKAIAESMGFDSARVRSIYMTALVHDIGKIKIPINILINPRKLTDIEMNIIRTHPEVGYDILKSIDASYPLAETVLQHHERLDGSGYPNKIKTKKILVEAKILAVADVVEAMASDRPYRPALGTKKALKEISVNTGKLYDQDIAEECLKLFRSKKFSFSESDK